MKDARIPVETLEESLAYFPADVPGTGYVLVKADQYTVFRQATLSLLRIYKQEGNDGKNS